MKQTQEFSGKDIDGAVKNACFELNLSKSDLRYDIISTGASGIFGIVGRKNAKIRVTLPDYTSKTKRDDDNGVQSIVDEAFGVKPKKDKPKKVNKKTSPSADKQTTEKKPADKQPADKKPVDEKPMDEKLANKEPDEEKQDIKDQENEKYTEREIVDVTQESIDLGLESIQKMISLITDDAKVDFETNRDRLLLKSDV